MSTTLHLSSSPSVAQTVRAAVVAAGLGLAAFAAEETRVWTSSDGKTVTAVFVSATDTTVTIKNDAGREFTFPHERLSAADREVIQAHLAQKKAELDSIVWPRPSVEEAIKAAFFKRLHAVDAKRFASTYGGKVLLIQGQVMDVKEDRMASNQGVLIVLDTEEKVPVEFRFNKVSYDKDLSILLGANYSRYRGPYDEDEFRVVVADKSLVVERRYVVGRDSYYTNLGNYRYRSRWSEWQALARPITRGDVVKIRGEFVSVFNSVMSFKDACLMEPIASLDRPVLR